MFMEVCNFKVQDGITLNSSVPEPNEQYITFFFKKQQLLAIQDSHKILYVFPLCCMLSFSSPPF